MNTQTISQQKQQYSRQLAVYTFRQWNNAIRESKPPESRGIPGEPGESNCEERPAKSPDEPAAAEKND
jgi:hypothetical protein